MKIHFASALPRQCFCRRLASTFTLSTLEKTSTKSKLVWLLPLLHISPRIRSIICTIITVQILLYAMQFALFSCQRLHFKNNFGIFILSSKVKTNMKER